MAIAHEYRKCAACITQRLCEREPCCLWPLSPANSPHHTDIKAVSQSIAYLVDGVNKDPPHRPE